MDFTIFGALGASDRGRSVDIGPWKSRIVLGLLLCRANRAVPVNVLREALWEDDPPRTAHKNLQGYVSGLRGLLGAAELVHQPPGYLLRVGEERVDALRFADLARRGRAAIRAHATATAADLLDQAVRLWRGTVLPDLASVPAIADEAQRLEAKYLGVVEDWAEATLALGRPAGLVDHLDELVARHPFRERLRHAQMLALYRAGRPAEALSGFEAMRQHLARELGLDPSPPLVRLYEAVLAADPGLDHVAQDHGPKTRERPASVRDVPAFTAREPEVAAVLEALGEPGAVLVVAGAAGVGKSALAVHCAHQLAERFPGGQVVIPLRTGEGDRRADRDVLGELSRGLGRKRVLVVLDDAASEEQVRRLLAAIGDAGADDAGADDAGADDAGAGDGWTGDAAVLITSRRPLTGLEVATHLRLDPMPADDGVRLLGRLAGERRVAAEPAAAYRVVAACGGLPLAIRAAAAKLCAVPHLPLTRYAERLADESRVVDRLCAGGLRVRPHLQRWLSEVVPDDREALRRLAVGAGPQFSAVEAADALGCDAGDAEDTVERLFEEHLHETCHSEVEAHAAVALALPPLLRAILREPILRQPR
jgi:DNA-binding SARP family transcriptional activator